MGRVVVVGSLNVDLVARVPRHPRPGETVLASGGLERLAGGKGANQAVAAAAAGARVALVGAVGDDDGGFAYLARLQARGIDVSGVRIVRGEPTGQAWVTVEDDSSENMIVVVPGANGTLGDGTGVDLRLDPGDVLLVQLEVPMGVVAQAVQRAVSASARVVVNAAPYAALPPEVALAADPVVVNEHEALLLADSDVTARSVLVTFGAAGCAWDGEPFEAVQVPDDEVVDTTGAGDAFCGALAAALATGAGRAEAVRAALVAGAEAVRWAGAQQNPAL